MELKPQSLAQRIFPRLQYVAVAQCDDVLLPFQVTTQVPCASERTLPGHALRHCYSFLSLAVKNPTLVSKRFVIPGNAYNLDFYEFWYHFNVKHFYSCFLESPQNQITCMIMYSACQY